MAGKPLRVVVNMLVLGQVVQNTLAFTVGSANATFDQLGADLVTGYVDKVRTLTAQHVQYVRFDLKWLDEPGQASFPFTITGKNGVHGDQPTFLVQSVVWSFFTGGASRSQRGRNYLYVGRPGWTTQATVLSETLTAHQLVANQIRDYYNGEQHPLGMKWVVWSKKNSSVSDIQSVIIRPNWGTRRSRGVGKGI